MSLYKRYSNSTTNQASTELKNKIIQKLKDNGYIFDYHYNDLYFLKSGQTVRRLKGYINSKISTYPSESTWENWENFYTLDVNSFLKVKQLVQSLSNNEFDCDFNKLKLDKYSGWNGKFTYILKITNK